MDDHESKDISDALSDLEDSPLTTDGHAAGRIPRRTSKRRHFSWFSKGSPIWLYWSIASTVCCLLFAVNFVYQDPKQLVLSSADTWKKENLIETKYFRDTRYMTLDHDADWLWKEYTLMSTGNIRVPDGNGSTALKSISMYHQMHCLAKMRMALQEAREGKLIGTDWQDDAHWPHCLDYLRSSIMCFADGTLESITKQPGPEPDTWVKVIDGGVETRYCRDTRPLNDLERQFGPNSQYTLENDPEGQFEVAPGR